VIRRAAAYHEGEKAYTIPSVNRKAIAVHVFVSKTFDLGRDEIDVGD
jgi:hypothetical protein